LINLYKKILVALDGSEPSKNALNHAVEHSVKWGADLLVISVIPRISPLVYARVLEEYGKVIKETHQRLLTEARTKINDNHPDLMVETRLEEGRPGDVIVEVAKEEDVDLIVLGSRGVGGIRGWVLGSTSRYVVETCTKPILIVK